MSDKRNNCIILLIDPPVPEKTDPELRDSFGAERGVHINLDLLQNAYKLAKTFPDAILILSYEKTARHPDLTWLDADDPGFLEAKGRDLEERIINAFRLAFNTGSKNVLLLNHLSPAVKPDWINQAFDSLGDKTVALGLNQDGSFYLLGLALNNIKLFEGLFLMSSKTALDFSEKAKRNKLNVFTPPEIYAVKNEETLRKWVEAKDVAPALFMNEPPKHPLAEISAPQPPPGEKRHVRHGNKNHHPFGSGQKSF
ncbi:MAG: DUF2064 domain-containing protein [Elusimicrobia bacterium]|nr:DUF2064 domain-containing protein [Elusimicrobiota bacterium]